MELKEIITHQDPGHLDDRIGTALVKHMHPSATITFVHPQGVPEEALQDPSVAVIDVGGVYEPEKNNFDHHQDREIPCSLVLVVKHFVEGANLDQPFLKAIDLTDRFGFQRAVQEGLVKPNQEIDFLRRAILSTELTTDVCHTVGSITETLVRFQKPVSYDEFIQELTKGLSTMPEYKKALETLQEQERKFREALKEVVIQEKEGLRIGLSKVSLAPRHSEAFKELELDLIIEANSFKADQTSLIVNTSGPNKDKAMAYRDKLIEGLPLVFRHATGFIAVVDVPVERFYQEAQKRKLKP